MRQHTPARRRNGNLSTSWHRVRRRMHSIGCARELFRYLMCTFTDLLEPNWPLTSKPYTKRRECTYAHTYTGTRYCKRAVRRRRRRRFPRDACAPAAARDRRPFYFRAHKRWYAHALAKVCVLCACVNIHAMVVCCWRVILFRVSACERSCCFCVCNCLHLEHRLNGGSVYNMCDSIAWHA